MFVVTRGGLGNQMFQAAFATALSAKFGVPARYVDLSGWARVAREWGLSCFGIEPIPLSGVQRAALNACLLASRNLRRLGLPSFPGVLLEEIEFSGPPAVTRGPLVVAGYWQGPAYFDGFENTVRNLFSFPSSDLYIEDLEDKIRLPLIAIHVRRGDYVSDPAAARVHLVCDIEWYQRAWRKICNDVGRCCAVVFSDDSEWARDNLKLNGEVLYQESEPAQPAWRDMARMSRCHHFIISNSSYSWWAAFLGKKQGTRVIAPAWWFRERMTASLNICPPEWVLL